MQPFNRQHQLHLERRNYGRQVDLHLTQHNLDGDLLSAAVPVTFKVVDEGSVAEPFLSLRPDAAQQLADQLWAAGFRPTQGEQSEGQHGAMNAHLQDMRTLVASRLEVALPNLKKD